MLNAAAWTHYSLALHDACAQLTAPLVEVHISDPKSRPEEFRHHSVVTAYAAQEITGQGIDGYRQALEFLAGADSESDGTLRAAWIWAVARRFSGGRVGYGSTNTVEWHARNSSHLQMP